MVESYFHRLLGVPLDVPAPDYFQLLGLAPDSAITYSRKAILQIFHLYPRADRV